MENLLGFLVFAILWLGVWGTFCYRQWFSPMARFKDTFGFKPSRIKAAIRASEQARVDYRLAGLARCLDHSFKNEKAAKEEQLDSGLIKTEWDKAHKVLADKIQEEEGDVRYWKRAFWEAHKRAKRLGFTVQEKYSDYLAGTR